MPYPPGDAVSIAANADGDKGIGIASDREKVARTA
jgi:hypothetical protein